MSIEEIYQFFRESYLAAIQKSATSYERGEELISSLKKLVLQEVQAPYLFSPFHKALREPFDYYTFGNDFFRALIDLNKSKIFGRLNLDQILNQLSQGENVILLANHQTEADPQVISILLEKDHPSFVENMIFVAGNRVITDPVAIPFSKGRNLLCIYSKRHIENPPELKEEKIKHNRYTLERLKELLVEGGKCIYVAPSGGRDRSLDGKEPLPALFDASSLELFYLIAKGTKTHFYPFAMKTYEMLPPPEKVQKELGEERRAKFVPVSIAFGPEIDEGLHIDADLPKKEKRELKAELIWQAVLKEYKKL